jgi:hypothetical protein
MSAIRFETKLFTIGDWTILHLPKEVSTKLPSRGQTMVVGTINGFHFETPLEPDGRGSHWFRVDESLSKSAKIAAGDTVRLELNPTKEWPEPDVPDDWKKALATHPQAHELWKKITPMARWEWIRWARATNNQETYKKRIEVGCDKLKKGERRPCCWNRNLCTEPYVSKNWLLIDPTQ